MVSLVTIVLCLDQIQHSFTELWDETIFIPLLFVLVTVGLNVRLFEFQPQAYNSHSNVCELSVAADVRVAADVFVFANV